MKEQEISLAGHGFAAVTRSAGAQALDIVRLGLAVVLAVSMVGCGHKVEGPDVILIVVDALRVDRFDSTTMPRLSRLAEEGTAFQGAFSQAPWTAPSMASIFTGLVSTAHGVVDHRYLGTKDVSMTVLDDGLTTLAEAFSQAGWDTAAFVSNTWLSPELGFAQGFHHFERLAFKSPAEMVGRAARSWLESADPRNPRFLYLHYMDTHGPYRPPEAYEDRFRERYQERRLTSSEHDLLDYLAYGDDLDGESGNLATYQRRYDGGAAYADFEIASLISELRANRTRETIVVFTSDHGEAFFEHGFPDHGFTLHDELIRVPLFFLIPGGKEGQDLEGQVELVDIFPTLAELVGLRLPDYELSGQSLAGVLRGAEPANPTRAVGAACFIRGPARSSIRLPNFKLIRSSSEQGEPGLFLYDLEADPGEKQNLALQEPELLQRALSAYGRMRSRDQRAGPEDLRRDQTDLDEETVEALRALGYLN